MVNILVYILIIDFFINFGFVMFFIFKKAKYHFELLKRAFPLMVEQ